MVTVDQDAKVMVELVQHTPPPIKKSNSTPVCGNVRIDNVK